MENWIEPVIVFFLLACSAFFSASETALLTLSKIRLKHMVKENLKGAKTVERLLEDPNKLLGGILVGNNLVNIAASAIATSYMMKIFSASGIGIATVLMTVLVLIFGEVTPKNLAILNAEKVSLGVSPVISLIVFLLSPLVYVLTGISNGFMKLVGVDSTVKKPFITQEELRTIVDVSNSEGILENDEKEMIYNVFEFGDLRVRDAMVQRMDIQAVSLEDDFEQVVAAIQKGRFSRLPVYRENIDDIVGVLYIKDVFLNKNSNGKFKVKDYMREALYTYEFIKIADFFKQMQGSNMHMAIVLDEYGGVAGIITMEDIIESIFGDINDEFDTASEEIKVIKEDEYVVNGAMDLEDLNEMIGTNLESEDFDSVGGFIIEKIGRLPKEGEIIEYQNIKFYIEDVSSNRIRQIRIHK